jgi:hypothetical protein
MILKVLSHSCGTIRLVSHEILWKQKLLKNDVFGGIRHSILAVFLRFEFQP